MNEYLISTFADYINNHKNYSYLKFLLFLFCFFGLEIFTLNNLTNHIESFRIKI